MNEILYYCERCGNTIHLSNVLPSDDRGTYTCPYCGSDYAVVLVKPDGQM